MTPLHKQGKIMKRRLKRTRLDLKEKANFTRWIHRREALQASGFDSSSFMHGFESRSLSWDEQEYDPPIPFVVKFSKCLTNGHLALVADEAGCMTIIDTLKSEEEQIRQRWQGHSNAIFEGIWSDNDRKILSGSGDQTIRVWDVERSRMTHELRGHVGSVKSIDCLQSNQNIVSTASRDGSIRIWDCRESLSSGCAQSTIIMENAHDFYSNNRKSFRRRSYSQPGSGGVTGVKFSKDDQILMSTGASDGKLKFWDMRSSVKTSTCKNKINPVHEWCPCKSSGCLRPHGAIALDRSCDGSKVLVSSCDHTIYIADLASFPNPTVSCLQGHLNNSFYVRAKFSPDGSYVIGGSSDDNVYVWNVPTAGSTNNRPGVFMGHDGEVNGVDWCPKEFGKAISCADDRTVRLWSIDRRLNQKLVTPARIQDIDDPVEEIPPHPPMRNLTLTEMWSARQPHQEQRNDK